MSGPYHLVLVKEQDGNRRKRRVEGENIVQAGALFFLIMSKFCVEWDLIDVLNPSPQSPWLFTNEANAFFFFLAGIFFATWSIL